MTIYKLNYKEFYSKNGFGYENIGYFSSEERATNYVNKLLDNYPNYDSDRFIIEPERLDPSTDWMDEK